MSTGKKYFTSKKPSKYIEEEAEESDGSETSIAEDTELIDRSASVVIPSSQDADDDYKKWCEQNNADEMESNPEPKYDRDVIRKIMGDKQLLDMGSVAKIPKVQNGVITDYLPPSMNRWLTFIGHVAEMSLEKPKQDMEGYYSVKMSGVQVVRFAGKDCDYADWIRLKSCWLCDIADYLKTSKHYEHSVEVVLNLYRILIWKNDEKHRLLGDNNSVHDWMDMTDRDIVVPVVALKYTIKDNICYVNLFLDGDVMLISDVYVKEKEVVKEKSFTTPKRKRSTDDSPPTVKRSSIGLMRPKSATKKTN